MLGTRRQPDRVAVASGTTASRVVGLLEIIPVREAIAICIRVQFWVDRSRALVDRVALSQNRILRVQRQYWLVDPTLGHGASSLVSLVLLAASIVQV